MAARRLHHRTREAGFSLIELMVAMTVSLVILAGVLSVFVTNNHAFRVHQASNILQENGRFALGQLSHSIRMAGHWGGVDAKDVTPNGSLAISGIGSCNTAWIADTDAALRGYDGDSSLSAIESGQGFPSGCIDSSDYASGSDILVVRYAEPVSTIERPGIFLRSSLGRRAVIGNAPSSGDIPSLGLPPEDGTVNYAYRIEAWLIRPCSVPSGGSSATACDAGDDAGQPIPTLTRLALEGDQLTEQPMYEGIEQLQLEYGRDMDGDGVVDRLDTASTLNASATAERDWSEVISVSVAIISRSGQQDTTFEGVQDFSLTGDTGSGTSGFTAPADKTHYLRKPYQVTAQIRNRVR